MPSLVLEIGWANKMVPNGKWIKLRIILKSTDNLEPSKSLCCFSYMKKSYSQQKQCASLLKSSLMKLYSSAPQANCMDIAKQKIKKKVIATVKAEMKKMIIKRMNWSWHFEDSLLELQCFF